MDSPFNRSVAVIAAMVAVAALALLAAVVAPRLTLGSDLLPGSTGSMPASSGAGMASTHHGMNIADMGGEGIRRREMQAMPPRMMMPAPERRPMSRPRGMDAMMRGMMAP